MPPPRRALLWGLLAALARCARAHITLSPNTVATTPYFTTQLLVSHSTAGYSSQAFAIQVPHGVKATPEQKPGWDLSIAYRTLPTPLSVGHGASLSSVPDVITYTAQAGGALPNEWMFQAFLSLQLLGADGSGCVWGDATGASAVSTWYGDGGSRDAPVLGLFFPVTVTLVGNPAGPGVGGDATNAAQQAAGCGSAAGCNVTAWTGVPTGAQTWSSLTTPAPYVKLPAAAWPSRCAGVLSYVSATGSANLTAPPSTDDDDDSAAPRARAAAAAWVTLAALVALAL